MISCEHIDEYLEGNLAQREQDRFEQHLPSCVTCQQEVQTARLLDAQLRAAWQSVSAPEGLADSIECMSRIDVAGGSDQRRTTAAKWLAIAASVSLVVLAGWSLLRWSPVQTVENTPRMSSTPGIENQPGAPTIESTESKSSLETPVVFYVGSEEDSIIVPQVSNSRFTIVKSFQPMKWEAERRPTN